jgi:pyruvate formate lyase activating enzyme
MLFGGLQKTTLVDYPGKIAATVFTLGCNFRCPYCHNPELVLPELIEKQPKIPEGEIINFLKEQQGLLQGLCITGGEPTLHPDLIDFMQKVKDLGYLIKLDSNGSDPKILKEIINKNLVDYIAMDVKTSLEKYNLVTLGNVPENKIKESIAILKEGRVDYEFRTTVVPGIVEKEDIMKIVEFIKGAPKYFLQRFKPGKTLNVKLSTIQSFDDEKLLAIISKIKPNFRECDLR